MNLSVAERISLAGVERPESVADPSAGLITSTAPTRVGTNAMDALESLLAIGKERDDERAAAQLAVHCQRHPAGNLLCAHGLPSAHRRNDADAWRERCRPYSSDQRAGYSLSVSHVRAVVNTLRAVERLARNIAARRQPVKASSIADATEWPLLGFVPGIGGDDLGSAAKTEYVDFLAAGDVRRHGNVSLALQRRVVADFLDAANLTTESGYRYEWLAGLGLRLCYRTPAADLLSRGSDLGLYVAAFQSKILHVVNLSGVDAWAVCVSCGNQFQPRTGAQRYCLRAECRRARKADLKRQERLKEEASS